MHPDDHHTQAPINDPFSAPYFNVAQARDFWKSRGSWEMAVVDNTTNCPVCYEDFEENGDHVPRILQCFHTVCEKCIKQLMKENTLECPECRTKHAAANGFLSFPQNKYVISVLRRNEEVETSDQFEKCESHNREVSLFCNDTNCQKPICSLCMLKDHKNHDIKDFEEIFEEKCDAILANLISLKTELETKKERYMVTKEVLRKETMACVEKMRECKKKYMETFDAMIKEATEQMEEMDEDIDEGATAIDTNLKLLTKMEDDIHTWTYEELKNSQEKVDEIAEDVSLKLSLLLEHKYPTYTESSVEDACGKLSKMEINPSMLKTRGLLNYCVSC